MIQPGTSCRGSVASCRWSSFTATGSPTLRRVVPLWAPAILLAVVGGLAYLGFHAVLGRETDQQLAAYQDVVQLPARSAHVTITLP